jgi:hypothetical protein
MGQSPLWYATVPERRGQDNGAVRAKEWDSEREESGVRRARKENALDVFDTPRAFR